MRRAGCCRSRPTCRKCPAVNTLKAAAAGLQRSGSLKRTHRTADSSRAAKSAAPKAPVNCGSAVDKTGCCNVSSKRRCMQRFLATPPEKTTGPSLETRRSIPAARRTTDWCRPKAMLRRSSPQATRDVTSDSAKTVHILLIWMSFSAPVAGQPRSLLVGIHRVGVRLDRARNVPFGELLHRTDVQQDHRRLALEPLLEIGRGFGPGDAEIRKLLWKASESPGLILCATHPDRV